MKPQHTALSGSYESRETSHVLGPNVSLTNVLVYCSQTQKVKTQLIAHDKEVFDIAFATGKNIFATVGADGSIRMFDLR